MSSFIRNIQRRALRASPNYKPAPWAYKADETGYSSLHPTHGWQRVSYRRYAAERVMADHHARGHELEMSARIRRQAKTGPKVYARTSIWPEDKVATPARSARTHIKQVEKPKRVRKPRAKKEAAA